MQTLIRVLLILFLSATSAFATSIVVVQGGGTDTTAPLFVNAVIATNGTTVTVNFTENVTDIGGLGNDEFDIDCNVTGDGITMSYASGDGTSAWVFTAGSTIQSGETCDLSFDGDANEVEDSAANDLADFTDEAAVTNNSTQGDAAIFFEADWDDVGATDEICDTTPCPGTWDDTTNSDDMAVAGEQLVFQINENQGRAIFIRNEASEVLNGNSISEYWVEFKITFSNTSQLAGLLPQFSLTSDGHIQLKLVVSGGAIAGIKFSYYHDAGFTTSSQLNWVPAASTQYTIRVHYKISSGSDDGIASVAVVGGNTVSVTSIDNNDVAVPSKISLTVQNSVWNTVNDFTISYDDFKLYTSDPSW